MRFLKRFAAEFFRIVFFPSAAGSRSASEIERAIVTPYRPRVVASEVVVQGDPGHEHSLEQVAWDKGRFGDSVTDFGDLMATFKDLYRCSCGHEVVTQTRALY